MKKKFLFLLITFLGINIIFAEQIKIIKIEGTENEYNQIKIINNTKYKNFDFDINLLQINGSNISIKETKGPFHFNDYNETVSSKMKLMKNDSIWISGPRKYGEFGFTIEYTKKTIIITLKKNTTIPDNSEGLKYIPYDDGYFKIEWMPYEYFFYNEKNSYYPNSIKISYISFDKEKQDSIKQEGSFFLINDKTLKVVIDGKNNYAELGDANLFKFLNEGTSTIVVKIGTDIEAMIDIKQTILPISKNDNIDVLIEKLGFPDKKKEISVKWPDTQIINGIYYDTTRNVENFYATHYFYKKYPCLCISFVNGSFRLGEFNYWKSELSD